MSSTGNNAAASDPWDDWESADYAREAHPASNGVESANNARLWEIANNSLSFGPSQLASSNHAQPTRSQGGAGSSYNANIPPPQAYMPSLKILKRPTSGSTSPNATAEDKAAKAALQAKTLKDREKAYLEARKKIFGNEEGASSAAANAALLPPGSPKAGSAEVSENDDGTTSPPLRQQSTKRSAERQPAKGAQAQQNKQNKKASLPSSPLVGASPVVTGGNDTDPLASSVGSLELPRSALLASRPSTRPATPAAPTFGQKVIREPKNPPSSRDHNGQPVRGFGRTEEQEIAEGQPPLVAEKASQPPAGKKKKNKKKANVVEQDTAEALGEMSLQDDVSAQEKAKVEKERKKVALSAAAQAFVPKGLVPARVADKSSRPTSPVPPA